MRIFKIKLFDRWARKEGISDMVLCQAVQEIEDGQFEANLGGNVYKKRIPLEGRGKRGGARTIVAYRIAGKAFFIFGYAKNEKSNLSDEETKAAKMFAKELLNYTDTQLDKLMADGKLIEVKHDE